MWCWDFLVNAVRTTTRAKTDRGFFWLSVVWKIDWQQAGIGGSRSGLRDEVLGFCGSRSYDHQLCRWETSHKSTWGNSIDRSTTFYFRVETSNIGLLVYIRLHNGTRGTQTKTQKVERRSVALVHVLCQEISKLCTVVVYIPTWPVNHNGSERKSM